MITYDRSAFGLNLIFRVHGSAIYRGMIPGALAVVTLILIRYFTDPPGFFNYNRDEQDLQHPYAIGILVSSISFLIVFRASQGYARYWEAAGAVHQMMSKWMDATVHTGCYHMQCAHYDAIKPPSFFDYPELNAYFLTRDRERYHDTSHDRNGRVMHDLDDTTGKPVDEHTSGPMELPTVEASTPVPAPDNNNVDQSQRKVLAEMAEVEAGLGKRGKKKVFDPLKHNSEEHAEILDRAVLKSINPLGAESPSAHTQRKNRMNQRYSIDAPSNRGSGPIPLTGRPRLDGNWGKLFPDKKATYYDPKDTDPSSPNYLNHVPSFASIQGGRTPSLFLQELTHLCSLLNAVALATLRNDVEGSSSPLGVYKPGEPWPEVDPDHLDSHFLYGGPWYETLFRQFQFFIGMGRSPEERTRYNAARPLEVLGGVSDAEIRFLQMARGPLAKTQLCWYWLTEFIIREHLNGSTGKVGPPIISRIIQFLSDGMIFYNHCRKIMFIPFPFPHAQLSVIFVLITIPGVAYLMDQYIDDIIVGSVLAFLSTTALAGIHEVARELENPFRNIPNELPLCTFQAQFNESLIVMYSGYHPDHFWDAAVHNHHPDEPPPGIRKYGSKGTKTTTRTSTARTSIRSSHKTPPTPSRVKRAVSADATMTPPVMPPSTGSDSNAVTPAAEAATTTSPEAAKSDESASTPNAEVSELHAQLEESRIEIARLTSLANPDEKKSN